MAESVPITVRSRPEHGQSVRLEDGFRWTVALNETDAAEECDFCNLQHPPQLQLAPGATSPLVFGRIFEAGLTDTTAGQAPGVLAELTYKVEPVTTP